MYSPKKEKKSKALRVAFIFISGVILLVVFSLIVKLSIVISESHFNSAHQFIMQVSEGAGRSDVIIFSPDMQLITIVTVVGSSAGDSVEKTLQIPIDSYMQEDFIHDKRDAAFVERTLWGHIFSQNNNVTSIDLLRLLLFTQGVQTDHISTQKIDMSTNSSILDNQIAQLFTDESLYKQGDTVAIVNGSGISGLGSLLARLLTHIGVNVISVTTASDVLKDSSIAYVGNSSYAVGRISNLLRLSTQAVSGQQVAKIIITIGTDRGQELSTRL